MANRDEQICLKKYITDKNPRLGNRSLLAAEMIYAKERHYLPNRSCLTLVLLLGYSPEPLLQSICAYKPEKIILILNKKYNEVGGHDYGTHFQESVKRLKDAALLDKEPLFVSPAEHPGCAGYIVDGSPAGVFQALTRALYDEKDVVIDVTGGKKSMVTGAFLYAAFAGLPISYVDFDDELYDREKRRPYGFACQIGELANPYQSFALREWERVKELYGAYRFRDVLELLVGREGKGGSGTISEAVRVYLPAALTAVEKMVKIIDFYEKWDGGDFNGAAEAAKGLPHFQLPDAVTCLGGRWSPVEPETPDFIFKSNIPGFYQDSGELRIYVLDELKRIYRLIHYKQDYRAAFLRAGSLNEIIMLARLIKFVENDVEREALLKALDNDDTPKAKSVFESLLKTDGSYIRIGPKRKSKIDIAISGAPEIEIRLPEKMRAWWTGTRFFNAENGWDDFRKVRNQMTHKYFSIAREWAEDGLRFVSANFEDFTGQPVSALSYKTETITWQELCDLCGLSGFLPLNLRA